MNGALYVEGLFAMAIPAAPAEIAESSLSVADVTEGIRNLSDGEQIKFKRASQYLGGAGARPAAELRHEAIRRAIAGSRKCPRHLPVVAFLIGTMRSIAHADRKALKRASRTLILADPSSSTILDAPDPRISPEEAILRTDGMAEMKARVLKLFEDDATARDIWKVSFSEWRARIFKHS